MATELFRKKKKGFGTKIIFLSIVKKHKIYIVIAKGHIYVIHIVDQQLVLTT